MKKVWKYAAAALGVAAISASVTLGVIAATDYRNGAGLVGDSAAKENEYGFKQTDYKLSSLASAGAMDFVPAAEASIHAVVHIKVESEQEVDRRRIMDPFEFFFGGDGRGFQRPQTRPVVGYGSGVIISTDGFIITNNHVVKGAKEMSVTLNDNRSFKAKLIGTDPSTDIALIKVDATGLPTIPFGDSDKLRVGEWVLAVGNPFNLTSTVTAGIVSAKGRSTQLLGQGGSLQVESFIQTDAAVNQGNSGGALVNIAGELVGINTMIYSQSGSFSGYSFAVPISIASKVVGDIKQFGTVQRAMLGIQGGNITEEASKEYKLKVREGALVHDFAEVSAALAAGMEKGDVITNVNGKKVKTFTDLQEQISRLRPGDVAKIEIDRKGTKKTLNVTLKNNEGGTSIVKSDGIDVLGAQFNELNSEQKRSLGVSYGIEVAEVKAGKLQKAGIKKGFIILSINRVPVSTTQEVSSIVSEALQDKSGENAVLIRGFYPGSPIRHYAVEL